MNLLEYILPSRVSDDRQWGWRGWTGGMGSGFRPTRANVRVNEENALTCQAVLSCTRALVEPLSTMPIQLFQTNDDYHRTPLDGWQEDLLRWPDPDGRVSGMSFRESLIAHQINWNGGGFAEIVWSGPEGIALIPIHPSRVTWSLDPQFDYAITNNDGKVTGLPANRVLHVPGMLPPDGIWSRGMVPTIIETIGYNLAVDRHGAKYFGSGAQPKGLFASKMNSKDYDNYRKQWKETHGSPESSELMMASEGSTYTPFSATNEDNQFLGTGDACRMSIALAYRVPVYMVTGKKESAANVEQLGIEFVVYALSPWANRIEGQLNLKLLTRAERRAGKLLEMQFQSLLRGNIEARMSAYQKGIMIGVLTINRCRQLEGLNGIGPAGDQNFVPANMTTAQRAEKGDMGNGGAMGSDHTGFPADNPVDHQTDPNAALGQFMKLLTGTKRDLFHTEMKRLEHDLPHRPAEWMAAARTSITDALKRLFTKEAKSAQSLMTGNKDSVGWCAEFFGRNRDVRVEVLTPACQVLALAGADRWANAADLESWLAARSSELIRASHDRDSKEVFTRKLEAWPTERARLVAEEILSAQTCGGKGGTPGPCPEGGDKPAGEQAQEFLDAHEEDAAQAIDAAHSEMTESADSVENDHLNVCNEADSFAEEDDSADDDEGGQAERDDKESELHDKIDETTEANVAEENERADAMADAVIESLHDGHNPGEDDPSSKEFEKEFDQAAEEFNGEVATAKEDYEGALRDAGEYAKEYASAKIQRDEEKAAGAKSYVDDTAKLLKEATDSWKEKVSIAAANFSLRLRGDKPITSNKAQAASSQATGARLRLSKLRNAHRKKNAKETTT